MAGYIKLPRGILDHPVFERRRGTPLSRELAFLWLLERAAFADTTIRRRSVTVALLPGQLAFSARFLAGAWNWDAMRVSRFLQALSRAGLVQIEARRDMTVISVMVGHSQSVTPPVTPTVTPNDTPPDTLKPAETLAMRVSPVTPPDTQNDTPPDTPPVTNNKKGRIKKLKILPLASNESKGPDELFREFDPRKEVYDIGKRMLGSAAAVTRLLQRHNDDPIGTIATLRQAQGKAEPREYLWRIIHGEATPERDWDATYRAWGVRF